MKSKGTGNVVYYSNIIIVYSTIYLGCVVDLLILMAVSRHSFYSIINHQLYLWVRSCDKCHQTAWSPHLMEHLKLQSILDCFHFSNVARLSLLIDFMLRLGFTWTSDRSTGRCLGAWWVLLDFHLFSCLFLIERTAVQFTVMLSTEEFDNTISLSITEYSSTTTHAGYTW